MESETYLQPLLFTHVQGFQFGASKPDSTSIRWRIFNCRRLKGLGTQPVEKPEYIYALSIMEQFSTEQNVGKAVGICGPHLDSVL